MMKLVDVKSSKYTDFDKRNNKEDPKFRVGDHVKTLLQSFTFQNGQKKFL